MKSRVRDVAHEQFPVGDATFAYKDEELSAMKEQLDRPAGKDDMVPVE